jgi:hypothetical protein
MRHRRGRGTTPPSAQHGRLHTRWPPCLIVVGWRKTNYSRRTVAVSSHVVLSENNGSESYPGISIAVSASVGRRRGGHFPRVRFDGNESGVFRATTPVFRCSRPSPRRRTDPSGGLRVGGEQPRLGCTACTPSEWNRATRVRAQGARREDSILSVSAIGRWRTGGARRGRTASPRIRGRGHDPFAHGPGPPPPEKARFSSKNLRPRSVSSAYGRPSGRPGSRPSAPPVQPKPIERVLPLWRLKACPCGTRPPRST